MFLQDAARLLEEGQHWAGLPGDALAFVLADVAHTGRWLIVVDEPDAAHRLLRGLRFFHEGRVLHLPADDARPYDGFSPSPEIVRERIVTLGWIEAGADCVVVAPARALLQRVPAKREGKVIRPEDTLDRDDLVQWLTDAGYLATGRVEQPGCFAVRGDVVDVWATGESGPTRIDFFDDEVEELHRIDPATQRTISGRLSVLAILPAREDRLDKPALDRLHRVLGQQVSAQDRGMVMRRRIVEELRAGIRFSAVEDYLPALVETVPPMELLDGFRTIVVSPNDVDAALRDTVTTAQRRWEALEDDERPLVPPSMRFVEADLSDVHKVWQIAAEGRAADLGAKPIDGYSVRGTELGPAVAKLKKLAHDEVRVGLVVDSPKRADRLEELLAGHDLRLRGASSAAGMEQGRVSLLVGDLPSGFIAKDSGWAFVPASALFGGRRDARRRERAHALFDAAVTTMAQLEAGALVVHRLHGVGRFKGMRRAAVQTETGVRVRHLEQDFVVLEFLGGDLLLPATRLSELSRYTPAGSSAQVKLDRLGGVTWEKRKGKVRDSLLRMAQDLLKLYARRELATREPYPEPGPMYRAFEARFPYDETPDQATAIEAVQEDLSREWPMDRLICGDVGFGKTEVAMRAAMRAVEAGKQVAVLCPTTVLAYQHLYTFRDRFNGFPVTIGMLSRFNTAEQTAEVKQGLKDGTVDIVVGTTAILGRGVKPVNLGLVVIDEEHRFGVKQKDRLKKMRTEVDVLAMSATPIPRTLQMALGGVREMSLMATPPQQRLAVRTMMSRFSETRVRDAIQQELDREGQVFFIHNRVETIGKIADKLREWVPHARFAVAHGQMGDNELEDVLVDFLQGRTDVLVCTAIVESGIDIPRVNTMLVNRADLFGIAQLYQLRGRVGRSDVRARCVLLVPEETTPEARKRLRVVVDHQQLGAGFHIAAADLELRGGGNLLGKAQSGNIDRVGYETWVELLENAVHEARGDLDRQRIDPEVEVPVGAFLPDDLIKDMHERLGWYRRFSDAITVAEVDGLIDELEEMTGGDLPPEVHNLAGLLQSRIYCRELGIERCKWLKVRVILDIHETGTKLKERLPKVIAAHPKRFKLDDDTISVRFTPREADRPFRYLRWVFTQLRRTDF